MSNQAGTARSEMSVVIVGGGIGGMAAAVALRRVGIRATIIERVSAIQEVGAGFWLSSNGTKVLQHLGCLDRLRPGMVETDEQVFRSVNDDALLYKSVFGDRAAREFGAPVGFVHRADLLAALMHDVPSDCIRLGRRAVDIAETDAGVTVVLDDGSRVDADVLIGADGIRSAVRGWRFGEEDPRFTGTVCWRSVFPADRLSFDPGNTQHCWFGMGRSIVSYALRGGEFFNFVGFVPADEVEQESWTRSGDIARMRQSFAGACDRVQSILDAVDDAFVTGLYFRDPITDWSTPRTTLLGDAAHPTLPTVGQGAQMALEDAVTVAHCLAKYGRDRIAQALAEYASRRRTRTARIHELARANERWMHLRDPVLLAARKGRFQGMSRLDPVGAISIGWMFGFDPIKALDEPSAGDAEAGRLGGSMLKRPVANRAAEMWRSALTLEERAGGWLGERAGYERFAAEAFPPEVEPAHQDLGGIPSLRIGSGNAGRTTILFFHGGGFCLGSARASSAFLERLATSVDGTAFAPDYALSPERGFPAAVEDAAKAYRALLAMGVEPRHIRLAGMDAGACLALSLAVSLRDAGEPLPAMLYFVSPLVDLTLSSPGMTENQKTDAWLNRASLTLMAASYIHDADPQDPRVSPIRAELAGLPPTLIQAASGEILADDASRLAAMLRAAGVDVRLTLKEDTVHGYPLFDFLPEAAEAVEEFRRMADGADEADPRPRGL